MLINAIIYSSEWKTQFILRWVIGIPFSSIKQHNETKVSNSAWVIKATRIKADDVTVPIS